MALDDGPPQQRAADDARQPQLVAPGHEDRGRILERIAETRVISLVAAQRSQPADLADAHGPEEGAVELGCLVAEGGRRADHGDPCLASSRERHEAREDLALPELVLGTADDQQVAGSGWRRAGRLDHGGQHSGLGRAWRGARLDRMRREPVTDALETEERDFYAILGAEPSATVAELRTAFREAVLRHHPDRASELGARDAAHRDPEPRLGGAARPAAPPPLRPRPGARHGGHPPLAAGRRRAARPRACAAILPDVAPPAAGTSRSGATWRASASRSKSGSAGPTAQDRWIIEHHIAGQDWRAARRALLAALRGPSLPRAQPDR